MALVNAQKNAAVTFSTPIIAIRTNCFLAKFELPNSSIRVCEAFLLSGSSLGGKNSVWEGSKIELQTSENDFGSSYLVITRAFQG